MPQRLRERALVVTEEQGSPPAEMDAVRSLVLRRATERRFTMADLSRGIGKNPAYIHQWIHRGSPRALPEASRIALARLLDLRPDDLLDEEQRQELRLGFAGARETPPEAPRPAAPAAPSHSVRCYSDEGSITGPGIVVQAGYPADFALSVSAERVGGRLMPGDVVGFSAFPPPRVGDLVVAVRREGGTIAALGWLRSAQGGTLRIAADEGELELAAGDHMAYRQAWIRNA